MPLTSSVVQQVMARFLTFTAYKKVKIKFKKGAVRSNGCKDLFKQKNYFGVRYTLKPWYAKSLQVLFARFASQVNHRYTQYI